MKLDFYDLKLLKLLQVNSKLTQRQLSESVNLSASAVNRRIAALEAAGVISATVAIVDPAAVGFPITVLVEVKLENERLDLIDEFRRKITTCPQAQQIYYVTGDYDFLVIFTVADMGEYEQLTRELFFLPGNVKSFKTNVCMQRSKVGLQVPL